VEERLTGYTRVEVSPLTGRKHQIRAHFFCIGHPIVGDTLYGDKSLQNTLHSLERLFSAAIFIGWGVSIQTLFC